VTEGSTATIAKPAEVAMAEKILMVCFLFPPQFGGATIQGIRLSKELQALGLGVALLADNDERPDVDDTYEGLHVFRRSTGSGAQDSFAKKVAWALRVLAFAVRHPGYRILHFHGIRGPEILIFPLLKLLGRRVVLKLTLAGADDPLTFANRRLLGGIYRRFLKSVDRFVSISPTLSDMAAEAGMATERVALLPNGVDANLYAVADDGRRQMLRERLGLPADAAIVLAVGAVEWRKGYDLLIEAFRRIKAQVPRALLVIAGPGNDAGNSFYVGLLEQAGQELAADLRFLGRRDDVHDLMAAADLFGFCSRREGFGTVVAEAMCTGIPVVTMDIPGVTQWIVGDNPLGHNCLTQDVDEFAGACVRFLRETGADQRKAQSEAAHARFGFDALRRRYVELYGGIA